MAEDLAGAWDSPGNARGFGEEVLVARGGEGGEGSDTTTWDA